MSDRSLGLASVIITFPHPLLHLHPKRTARQVIVAGGANQEVLDSGPDGHSIFTHALLEALDQGLADARRDGYIFESDLISYLRARASNSYQTPADGNLPGHGLGEFMFKSPKSTLKSTSTVGLSSQVVRRGEIMPAYTSAPAPPTSVASSSPAVTNSQYTIVEYNIYMQAAAEKVTTKQLASLDYFVAKFPNSALLSFAYPMFAKDYAELKNFPKVIESADKTLALGDRVELNSRLNVYFLRAYAYTALPVTDPMFKEPLEAQKAREAAKEGLSLVQELKPDNVPRRISRNAKRRRS